MNEYRFDILVRELRNKNYQIYASFPVKAQNKEEALQSLSRNDVQSVIKGILDSEINKFSKTIKIQISFDNRQIYEVSQRI